MPSAASTSAQRVKQAELARILGVSRQAIGDLVKRKVFDLSADGRIDVDLARHALTQRVRPSAKTAATILAPAATAPKAAIVAESDGTREASTSYHVAKTLREVAEARLAKMRADKMRGDTVMREDVDRFLFEAARELRDGLTVCSRRISAEVAGLASAEACEAVIDREHRQALELLTKTLREKLGEALPA